jgi:methyltransferase (TIGR00027 family)
MRATEQRRAADERILDDPYAKLFLGRLARAALASWDASGKLGEFAARLSPGMAAYVLTRHRFIDDCLQRALAAGVGQLVLLGAGYDSRAYRFAAQLKGRPVFEVDFPATSLRKARILSRRAASLPSVDMRRIEIDFETESLAERLREAGFTKRARSFVVWEGVSMYLTRNAVKGTLSTLHAIAAPRSELAMDFWYLLDAPDVVSTAYRMSANLLSLLGEPVTFGIHPEDVGPFLARLGYRVRDLADATALEHRYVRDGRRVLAGNYLVHAVMGLGPRAARPQRTVSLTKSGRAARGPGF